MKDFLENVLKGNTIDPPENCLRAFEENFSGAVNMEWHKRNESFEVIFYLSKIEHIALFDKKGTLVEYLQNLPEGYLPKPLKILAGAKGEIMNTVMRNKGNKLEYEIIYRDSGLKRHLLILSEFGDIIEEQSL